MEGTSALILTIKWSVSFVLAAKRIVASWFWWYGLMVSVLDLQILGLPIYGDLPFLAYIGEDVDEPEFQYVPQTPHVSDCVPRSDKLQQSVLLLADNLASGSAIIQFEVSPFSNHVPPHLTFDPLSATVPQEARYDVGRGQDGREYQQEPLQGHFAL